MPPPLTPFRETERLQELAGYAIMDTPPERGFDDVVELARQVCGTPVALVSLVGGDRQWFKARIGVAERETDLDRSVCRFVVEADDIVVIPDLALDARTRLNPVVTGDPAMRFYAGAPLRSPSGHVLGALCVIDHAPRPDGLAPAQRTGLAALAAQVVDGLELRRRISERDDHLAARNGAEAAMSASERKWRGLFENLNQGFLLARVVRDADGRVVDWRYEEVNRAWGDLLGIDPATAISRTVREVMPGIEDAWIDEFAAVVETGDPIRFIREVGAVARWYDGFGQAMGDDRFAVLFQDATERVQAERRQAALLDIVAASRDCPDVASMTRTVAAIVGQTLGASRASYGEVDAETETLDLEPGWVAPGIASIEGHYRFDDFGRIRDELALGEPLVIHEVDEDERTASDPGPMRSLKIRSIVNMPVRERGRTVAVFVVHSDKPRVWTAGELAFIRTVADRLETGIARLRADDQQEVLNREIGHRLKNSLAMAQAIANQSLRHEASPTALENFNRRLQALGTAHEVLVLRNAANAELDALVRQVLAAAGVGDRYTASGPMVLLGSRAALSTSLLLHELATNAMKYGALSTEGRVAIEWRVEDVGTGHELVLRWREEGGPPVIAPASRGFGSKLLRLGLIGTGGSTIDYDSSGLSAVFRAPLDQVVQA